MPRTVVIVDDHDGFRAEATSLLGSLGYEVVASCADGRSAVAAVVAHDPDVVLLDVQLPDTDGFRLLPALCAGRRHPIVVLISSREAADYGGRVARCGAAGFITKAELSSRSLGAIVG
jgi:DNA-binding NarL/FixJ family response regulator